MADFRVVTERLSDQAATLHGYGGSLESTSALIVGTANAAADTWAAGVLAAATATWANALANDFG